MASFLSISKGRAATCIARTALLTAPHNIDGAVGTLWRVVILSVHAQQDHDRSNGWSDRADILPGDIRVERSPDIRKRSKAERAAARKKASKKR